MELKICLVGKFRGLIPLLRRVIGNMVLDSKYNITLANLKK